MPSRNLNRMLWAGVIVLLIVFGMKMTDTIELIYAGVGKLYERDAPEEDTVYLRWRGKIDAPMAARLTEAFEKYGGRRQRFVLALSSPGGSVGHGGEVVRLLNKFGATHRIETLIDSGARCASMCVPVYLQGHRRTAAANAKFMFHEVSFREQFSSDAVEVPASATGKATDAFFDKYFKPAGVPAAWIAKVRAAMSGGHDVWKSAGELIEEKAGIVQDIDHGNAAAGL